MNVESRSQERSQEKALFACAFMAARNADILHTFHITFFLISYRNTVYLGAFLDDAASMTVAVHSCLSQWAKLSPRVEPCGSTLGPRSNMPPRVSSADPASLEVIGIHPPIIAFITVMHPVSLNKVG
jgi:hypothetical protein